LAVKRFNVRKGMAFLLSTAICICNINVGSAIAADDGSGFIIADHELTENGMGAVIRVEESGPDVVITSVDIVSGKGTRVSVNQEENIASPSTAGLSTAGQVKVWKADRENQPDNEGVETNQQDSLETESAPSEGETTEPESEAVEPEGEAAEAEGETAEPEGETAEPEGETAEPEGEAAELEDETAGSELKNAEIKEKVTRSRSEIPVVKTSSMSLGENDVEESEESHVPVEAEPSEEEEGRSQKTEAEETAKPDSEKPETGTGNVETGKPGTGDTENGDTETGKLESGTTETAPPENEKPDESTPSEADKPLPSETVTSTPSEAVTSTPSDAGSNSDEPQGGDYEYQEFAFYVNENGRYRFKVEYVMWQNVEVTGSNRKRLQKTVGTDTELQEGDVVQRPVTKTAVLNYRIDDISGLYFGGLSRLETHVGEAVDLMEGVSAEDESRKPVEELRISDDGGVNLNEAGEYTVTYEAVHPISGVVYQAERSVSVLPYVNMLADDIQITSSVFGESEGKTLEYLLGSGKDAAYDWSIEAVVPEGTDRKITVAVPSIFRLTGMDSAEASVSNLGSVCEFTIHDEVPAGAVIGLNGTFQQLGRRDARFETSLEDEYRETGEVEFGSISASMTRGESLVGKSEIGPLVTKNR